MNLAIHYYPIENLVEYERNPRKNDDVVNRMCASIREFGFRIPIVAKSDGTVVDGHLRLKAARKLGMESIPVVLSDNLSDGQTKAFRLLANQSANWAKWDDDLLKVEIQELEDLEFDLKMTGFELEKVQRFLDNIDGKEEVERGEKEGVELVDKKSVVSKPGDLWILGGHRIYCGDSCLVESFKAVLDDKMADITVCDPPYNVAYGDSQEREDKKILNDDQGEKYELFLYDICTHVLAYTKGAIYICASSSELSTLQKVFEEAGGRWSTFIIWAKNHFTLGRSDYQRQYESILYGWKKGNKREWHGGRNQSDLWFYDKPTYNSLHPTMKPVELMERAIVNSSRPGDIVLDPFSGSGSTLIACERTGRICRTIELDPTFVDVTIKRWQVYTGAPREAFRRQLVKTQPRQSLANSLEQTIILHKVTSVVKLMEWTIQGTTKVKVLSPEMPDVIEVDIFRIMEDSMKDNDKASYHSLYRDPRPCHVLRWILNELGRSFVFLLRYVETSQQRRGLMEDTKEVGLIGSTQSVGKPHTRGSGQQYSNWNRDCNTDTTEIGGICKEN